MEQNKGKYQNNHKQNPGQRRSITHAEIFECTVVQMNGENISGIQRTAAGDNIRTGKLLERIDKLHDGVEEQNRRNHRQRNVKKPA